VKRIWDSLPIIPEIADCSAFGETEEGALQEVKIGMEPRLQTAKEIDRAIPVL
jgi:predicted RNase H-like HicB family nuclease